VNSLWEDIILIKTLKILEFSTNNKQEEEQNQAEVLD